jgi:hypothetical protein
MNATPSRSDSFVGGLVAAWVTTVLVALIVSIVFTIYLGGGLSSLKYSDAGSAIFLISFVFCSVSAVVGFIATVVLGVPIFKASIALGYTGAIAFCAAGLLTSFALAGLLYVGHIVGDILAGIEFQFALIAIFISGPLGGVSFWAVYRRG